jgi:hypothetical protein
MLRARSLHPSSFAVHPFKDVGTEPPALLPEAEAPPLGGGAGLTERRRPARFRTDRRDVPEPDSQCGFVGRNVKQRNQRTERLRRR